MTDRQHECPACSPSPLQESLRSYRIEKQMLEFAWRWFANKPYAYRTPGNLLGQTPAETIVKGIR